MAPTEQEIQFATNALRKEAGQWDDEASEIAKIVPKAEELRFSRVEGGLFQVIFDTYGQVLDQVIDRCNEGRQRMTDVGETLRLVANTYDREEAENVHEIRGIY